MTIEFTPILFTLEFVLIISVLILAGNCGTQLLVSVYPKKLVDSSSCSWIQTRGKPSSTQFCMIWNGSSVKS